MKVKVKGVSAIKPIKKEKENTNPFISRSRQPQPILGHIPLKITNLPRSRQKPRIQPPLLKCFQLAHTTPRARSRRISIEEIDRRDFRASEKISEDIRSQRSSGSSKEHYTPAMPMPIKSRSLYRSLHRIPLKLHKSSRVFLDHSFDSMDMRVSYRLGSAIRACDKSDHLSR